jgi:hypothetical protein
MLNPEERWIAGWKALKQVVTDLETSGPHHQPGAEEYTPYDPPLPSLQQVIAETDGFAPGSLLLGICDDGLPLVLNLHNPAPGSLLIAADPLSGKTNLLRSILHSAVQLNAATSVSFYILAENPSAYADLENLPHIRRVTVPQDRIAGSWIEELAELVEERQRGRWQGPVMVLVIDGLASLLHYLDPEQFARLYWLVRHGPRSRVWVLASLSSASVERLDSRLLAAFRTTLLGSIAAPGIASYLAQEADAGAEDLAPGLEFCVRYGEQWIHFWICTTEDSATWEERAIS